MCQLLGMNCNTPTDICFSFTGFQARGGVTDVHTDGWGIAFFEGKGVRHFLDPLPSAESPVAALVRDYPIKSRNVIAHIRKATKGRVALENTHPFVRELWGRYWVFAHNGHLESVVDPDLTGSVLPVGDTDSEKVFCFFMDGLRRRFPDGNPGAQAVFDAIHEMTMSLAGAGELNFLLSNGDFLLAHCSTNLTYLVRQAPFAEAVLKDQDVSVDFNALTTARDRVAVVATQALTQNERWIRIEPGQLLLFQDGAALEMRATAPGPAEKIRADLS